ncbi:hypothetical protein M407DRAFT_215440 [Tulasnella calospora MUT 4182]|uniref:Uncharacterized protein n=1 Tax=Tulasnella calospora MUT 4182 TaxID=1051891 RepID=A0A0C3KNX4_9AGAM|nr:hypothetical protein M407DRAFT_215440 [Tulasnella calospora MUT 4182]
MDRPTQSRNPASSPFFAAQENVPYSSEPVSDDPNSIQRRLSMKRKKTLVSLLNEIVSLKEEDFDMDGGQEVPAHAAVSERIKNLTVIVDDRLQNEGAALFNQFNKRVRQVDEQLLTFGNAVRPLGSSVGLISSSYNLRDRLQQILHLFRENASEAFPNKIKKEPVEPLQPLSSRKKRGKLRRLAGQPRSTRLTSDLEDFPRQFELLAKDLVTFLHFLHDIPEFRDESLNASVLSFEGDLKYWASCLKEFEGQFGYPAIKRYVNDLTREMDEHMEAIRDALKLFVVEGVTTIRTAQNHTQNGLQNLSTVATFFSGVTATTIQYTFEKVDIASSINSQLAYHWRAAMYRSPRSAVPFVVMIWLTRTPLIFLVVSVMAFSAGLVCFTYSSAQGRLVTTCATIFTSLTSLALLAVAVWFAMERAVYAKTKGSRWLEDIMREWRREFLHRTGLLWVAKVPPAGFKKAATWSSETLAKFGFFVSSAVGVPSARRGSTSTGSDPYDVEEYNAGLPTPNTSPKAERMRRFSSVSDPKSARVQTPDPPPLPRLFPDRGVSSSPVQERAPWSRVSHDHPPPQDDAQDPPPPPTSPTPKMRFRDAVKKVRTLERMKPTPKSPKSGSGSHARERSLTLPPSSDGHTDPNERFAPRPTRLAGLIPKLKALKPTQELIEHGGLVRHLQFSPDGKWLATCSWDRKAIIWKVEGTLSQHRVLAHPGAGFLSQVAWSPDGKHLLTRTYRHVKIWLAETGVLKQTISCKTKIEAVTWMPTGASFACVEGSSVRIMDLHGKTNADHTFERLDIHDVAITYDEQRLVPKLSFAGFAVYHLVDKKVECQVPVLENVRDVTISSDISNGYLALISYEDTAPPELWRISLVNVESRQEARLHLLQTYMPTAVVEFAGPSYLGGIQDQFVICAGKKGDIHIWDRETGLLLHSLQGANIVDNTPEDLTGVAWNHCATGRYMFASATNDGTVRIWTAQAPPDSQQPSRTGSPTPSVPRPTSAAIGLAV